MNQSIDARLRRVMEGIFGGSVASEIFEKPNRPHPAWDSIAHINLVMALEQELGVRFTPEEAGVATTLEALTDVLRSKSVS